MTPILSATLLCTQSDARLAMLTTEGNDRAFEAIVERYRRTLHRYLRRMLQEARSEDALQQTFIKAWTALGAGGIEVKDLKPWLYRIAHNTALDALKKAGYDYDELQESLRSADAPDIDLERRTVMRETLAGMAALPDRQREALLRVAVEGQSRAQVAHDLGLSDGAVRALVHRARMTLRAAATAITPLPLATWAAAARQHHDPVMQRVAELAAGGGAAGGAGLLLKGGAVIVAAGALAVGPSALKPGDTSAGDRASAAATVADAAQIANRTLGHLGWTSAQATSDEALRNRASHSSPTGGGDDHSAGKRQGGPGGEGDGIDGGGRSASSGPGPSGGDHFDGGPGGGEDHSGSGSGGPGPSGSGTSGSSDSGSGSRSGSSGDGGSGSASSGSTSSGSGSSGSGSSGSGSGGGGGPGPGDGSPADGH